MITIHYATTLDWDWAGRPALTGSRWALRSGNMHTGDIYTYGFAVSGDGLSAQCECGGDENGEECCTQYDPKANDIVVIDSILKKDDPAAKETRMTWAEFCKTSYCGEFRVEPVG